MLKGTTFKKALSKTVECSLMSDVQQDAAM
jgi:hypothetical protein